VRAREVALPVRPESRAADRFLELGARDAGRRADVEAHGDVGGEPLLDLGRELGREPLRRAVVHRAEGDAVVVRGDQRVAQGEDLEPAGVGEDRAVPRHEPVQPAELGDELLPGPEVQVVRVAEQDRRADRAQLVRVDGLDRSLRPDGHERRRRHVAVRGVQHAGSCSPVRRGEGERAHRISIASPKE
jgi:hypothetical protein